MGEFEELLSEILRETGLYERKREAREAAYELAVKHPDYVDAFRVGKKVYKELEETKLLMEMKRELESCH
jgi:hypothetical protein